jgi:prephenate dehydrogenase
MFKQLGLIGCGLMGSSFALALQRAGLVERVTGFSPSPASTAMAMQMGVIDKVAASAAQALWRMWRRFCLRCLLTRWRS